MLLTWLHTIIPWSQDWFIHKPSELPGQHTALLLFLVQKNDSDTQAFTVLPGTHLLVGLASVRVGKVPCLAAKSWSIIQPSQGSNLRSLTCKSHMLPLNHDAPRQDVVSSTYSRPPMWYWYPTTDRRILPGVFQLTSILTGLLMLTFCDKKHS